MLRLYSIALGITFLSLASSPVFASEPLWANLKARFVYDGKPPEARRLNVNKDQEVCAKGKSEVLDESLLVHSKNGGLANVVVWLVPEKGKKLPEEHPSYLEAAKKDAILDTVECRYVPYVVIVRTKQKLRVMDSDPLAHHAVFGVRAITRTSPFLPPGKQVERFELAEPFPAPIACSIHPWMRGWAVIQDHPYTAVSRPDGQLEIPNMPAGKWTFRAWHERAGWLQEVTIDEERVTWKKGCFDVELNSGDCDLGTINLSPEAFKK